MTTTNDTTGMPVTVAVPSVEDALTAYRGLDAKNRAAFITGLDDRMRAAVRAASVAMRNGDAASASAEMEIAAAYETLVEAVTAPNAHIDDDLVAATRWATFTAVTTDMWDAMSERARTIATGGIGVDARLRARIEGVGNTSASVDGGTRAGSGESKGNVYDAVAAFFEAHPTGWHTMGDIAKWITDAGSLGYRSDYRLSSGAVSAAIYGRTTDGAIAWRATVGIRAEQRYMGGETPVWAATVDVRV